LPRFAPLVIAEIEKLATSTNMSVRNIKEKIGGKASRGAVGEITKQVRAHHAVSL
jgi:hypothetical protein